jgi:hypothetical protein
MRITRVGFTLIELVLFIVIAGIFVPLTYIAFAGALKQGMDPENVTSYRLNAEQVVELTAKQIPALTTNFTGAIPSLTTCGAISGCTVTATYQTFNGSGFNNSGSPTNYVKIRVDVGSFTSYTIVTKHDYP